jgi:hypothetical protein
MPMAAAKEGEKPKRNIMMTWRKNMSAEQMRKSECGKVELRVTGCALRVAGCEEIFSGIHFFSLSFFNR